LFGLTIFNQWTHTHTNLCLFNTIQCTKCHS